MRWPEWFTLARGLAKGNVEITVASVCATPRRGCMLWMFKLTLLGSYYNLPLETC